MSACSITGCERKDARNVPQVVVVVRDRISGKRWTIPAVVGLCICDEHKASVREPKDILMDGGDKVVKAVLGLRHIAELVSTSLGWTTNESEDYRRLQESRAS